MSIQYSNCLKKKLCEDIYLNGKSTSISAKQSGVPLKTLEKWVTSFNNDSLCFDYSLDNDFKIINTPPVPNYNDLNPLLPFQFVVSDMTAFWAGKHYYELTLFMDLFNNEIISYSLFNKKGNPSTYHNALLDILTKKEDYRDFEMILHSD